MRGLLVFVIIATVGAFNLNVQHVGRPLHFRCSGTTLYALSSGSNDQVADETALAAMERIETLNVKFGVNCGASNERCRLNAVVALWETQQQEAELAELENDDETDPMDLEEADLSLEDNPHKFVQRHSRDERVAIFGGNPAKRKQMVEKRLAPYKALDQFGTPRDVGPSDTTKLLRKIKSGTYDVVYIWTRFNCHSSRSSIRDACASEGTRVVEVESLSYIR